METSDITVQILRDIRDSIAQTKTRLDHANTRLDHLYVGQRGLETAVHEMNAGQRGLETAVHEMSGTLGDIRELFVSRRDLRHRVERCEREIVGIKQRMPGKP